MVGEEEFRRVMGHFATGVTVVASRDLDGKAVGLTVNAFTSVSLDPPLVLVCVHKEAEAHDPIREAGHFGVSFLGSGQADLALRFSVEDTDVRFRDVGTLSGSLGSPLIEGSLAWMECRLEEVHPGGDHSIFVGEVVACEAKEGDPLLFFRGSLNGWVQ
jgi:flavin reductase (DIM6/NTAB) family NADH-FMN oxidoreductase RutF